MSSIISNNNNNEATANGGSSPESMIIIDNGNDSVDVVVVEDHEDDNDDDNNTSRTANTRSQQPPPTRPQIMSNTSKRSIFDRSTSSLCSGDEGTTSGSFHSKTSSYFEINCSPARIEANEKSYYEQTRLRRKQQAQQQQQQQQQSDINLMDDRIHVIPSSANGGGIMNSKQIAQHWRRPSNDQQKKRWQPPASVPPCDEVEGDYSSTPEVTENNSASASQPHPIHNFSDVEDDIHGNNDCDDDSCHAAAPADHDDSSCYTLMDSAMSFSADCYQYNQKLQYDDDYDGDGDTDLNTETASNPSTIANNTDGMSAATSINSTSIESSISRGEEHIASRMKKYGLFNLQELKRKKLQQQRRGIRGSSSHQTGTGPGNNNSNNNNNSTYSINLDANNASSAAATVKKEKKDLSSIIAKQSQAVSVSVNSGLTEGMTESISGPGVATQGNNNTSKRGGDRTSAVDVPTRIRTAPLHVQMAVEEIHRWLFTEGGHFEDVEMLMTQYSLYVREHFGIPLDRLYYGGVGLHPKLTAYLWKWEAHGEFTHSEMPPEVFERRNEIFSPDEPFCVLEQGRADHVRIKDTDSYIPPDTEKWFRGLNYKDYFALPDVHRGISKGGLAWATKCADGFCDDDIQFFRMTHAAMTTIMRLHTNDLVLNTLTDRMEAEIDDRTNQLAIANRKLEEANNEISRHAAKQLEHFACMSHEIRTPLNCIVGLSSLLLENDDLNDDLLDTINMVYNSADLVQGVVNDVLDYAKIESGHFELDVRPSDLQTALNGVVHSISNKIRDKNVEVRTSYSAKLSRMMTTDRRRLQQILYNILGNAAKFSPEGTTIDFKVTVATAEGATIETSEESKTKEQHTIRFSIKDYGKGIEEKNFEKVFQPFSQASKETQTVYGGTGLGLSITKNLVTRLGGTISIKSEVDKFTELIVELPFEDELVDVFKYKEKLSETSIVILNLSHDANGDDGPFLPFPKEMIELYDLSVIRCSSWGDLESKLGLRASIRENYVFFAHEDIEERQGMAHVEKLVRKERCSWFTFGSDGSLSRHQQRQYHFKSLTEIFPSVLLDKISECMVAQRETSSLGGSSLGSSKASSIMEDDDEEELELQLEDAAIRMGSLHSSPASLNYSNHPPKVIATVIEPSQASSTTAKKKFASKYPKRDLKVLIVDDNTINQKVLDRILKRLGVSDISIVDNGKKAVDISAKTKFDCIFMDMEMPVMGGLEACKLITDRDKTNARVTFVTAHDIRDIREKADAAGAYGYLAKPLNLKDIHEFLVVLESDKIAAAAAAASAAAESSRKQAMEKKAAAASKAEDEKKDTTTTPKSPKPKKRSTPLKKKKRNTKEYPPRSIKVLVAEDNLINQKVLDRILKRIGVTDITIVDNGLKAVHASETTKFDCILMDMQMPVMDGLEATQIIVKRDQEKGIDGPKIVFVTAHALVEFREKAMAAGAFDFITKPFKMEDIDNVLKIVETIMVPSSPSELPPPPISAAADKESDGGSPPPKGGSETPDTSATGESSASSAEEYNSNAKPTKMPKLEHSNSQ